MHRIVLVLHVLLISAVVDAQDNGEPSLDERVKSVVAQLAPDTAIDVRAVDGVVTLTGTVTDSQLEEQLRQTVASMDGVLAVRDKIELDLSVTGQVDPVAGRLQTLGLNLLRYLPLAAIALAVVLVFWLIAAWLGGDRAIYRRFSGSQPVQELIRSVVRLGILVLGIVIALDILNATAVVGGILGAAGVVGIAVGFAFRDLIENYIASLMLSIRQPFRPDDHVIIDGKEGVVSRLTTRSTILMTFDGNTLRLPNSLVFKSVITNFTSQPERRFEFTVGVGYDVDLTTAQRIGLETISSVDGVLDEPAPTARVDELGDSTVTLQFLAWVNQDTHVLGAVRSRTLATIKRVFDEHDIDMPEPTYNLRMAQVERIPERAIATTSPSVQQASQQYAAEDKQDDFIRKQAETDRREAQENMIDSETPSE